MSPKTFSHVQQRLAQIPNDANRARAEMYLRRKVRCKPQTLLSLADPIVALGQQLGERAWDQATSDDVFLAIESHTYRRGAHLAKKVGKDSKLAPSTQYQWASNLRRFYRSILGVDGTPPQFRDLEFRKEDAMQRRLRELALSAEQVCQLLAGATSQRDRFILLFLLETGFRVSEAAAVRLDTMERRRGCYWITLDRHEPLLKRGPRTVAVPLYYAQEDLHAWLAQHPRRHEAKAPLFVNLSNRSHGTRMTGKTISEVVARCARRAGLKVHAHMLRHTSATFKLLCGMPAHVIRALHGWTEDSTMLGYYTHMLPHFENEVLKLYGLPAEDNTVVDIMGSRHCLVCWKTNKITAVRCVGCGILLADALQESQRQADEDRLFAYILDGAVEALSDDLLLDVAQDLGFTEATA
jgi:site-specific recombinase XerD